MTQSLSKAPPATSTTAWLNRTTLGVSLASLLSDVSHEMATAVLPAFLLSLGTAGIGVCTNAWQAMLRRVVAWIGRGSRGPARDVWMAEGSPKEAHGRAFGLERSADAMGAVRIATADFRPHQGE